MGFRIHYLPDIIVAAFCVALAFLLIRRTASISPRRRTIARLAILFATCFVILAAVLSVPALSRPFDHSLVAWTRCIGIFAAFAIIYSFFLLVALSRLKMNDPGRRRSLRMLVTAAVAAPVAIGTFAILRRDDLIFREVDIGISGLPPGLNGLRIAQLTDIHLSPFVSEATLLRAIGMANDARPHLTFVTGDLISFEGDPLDLCLRHLAGLRADSGVWGCLGNHERYALAEDYTETEAARFGLRFLRREATQLRFDGSTLNLVGVDYQKRGDVYLSGIKSLVETDSFNLLLSHNPDVFPVAARQGFDLTIAGHTHGGQVTFEMVHPALNVSRFFTPYVHGVYTHESRKMYVSRGIGTIGVPARLGATPEVALVRLSAG